MEPNNYILFAIKKSIKENLQKALESAITSGDLPELGEVEILLEKPRDTEHGDIATNIALTLTKKARQSPRQIAEKIASHFALPHHVEKVEIAGPGFINFYLDKEWHYEVLKEIASYQKDYGNSSYGKGQKVQIEFVSANPTGPLVVVNARAAAVGDSLTRVMSAVGYSVQKEFYINDAGKQVNKMGMAMETRLRQLLGEDAELPEGAYPGEYLIPIAQEYLDTFGKERVLDVFTWDEKHKLDEFSYYAIQKLVSGQKETLRRYGVEFDVWFSEQSLTEMRAQEDTLYYLQSEGFIYEQDGALWFRSTQFGDDKDRVLVRSDGSFTYFLSDIAYHRQKLQRGYNKIIDIWGADHHGYIERMHAGVQALGYSRDTLEILITQMVRLIRGGELVRMSKRAGEYITMDEFLEEVGTDAARYFFLMRSSDAHLDFDLDLARLQGNQNPVYYVQYAHARIAGIIRQAKEEGLDLPAIADVNLAILEHPSELALLAKIAELPEELIVSASSREPHRLTHYAQDLANFFHVFYTQCRVLGEEKETTEARLVLIESVRIVMEKVLNLLGVSAPERM